MSHRKTYTRRVFRPRGRQRSPLFGGLIVKSFLIAIVLVAGLTAAASGDAVLVVGGHTFEYLGVTYNDDGTSTWTYRVTSGSRPSLSHWVLELDPSLGESNVVDALEDYEVNTDRRMDLYGLKFDEGYDDNETREVFGDKVFGVVVHKSIRFAEASVASQAMAEYAGNHKGTLAYRELAQELLARG